VRKTRGCPWKSVEDAVHVTTLELKLTTPRSPNPMEPRWLSAILRPRGIYRHHTFRTTSQHPHVIRLLMGAFCSGHPLNTSCRFVAPMWGGASGTKIFSLCRKSILHLCTPRPVTVRLKVDLQPVRGLHVRRARARPCDQDPDWRWMQTN